jgi:MFS family permease
MNINVERLFEKAGDKGRFQLVMLALGFCFWVTLDLLSISLPYLEKTSIVSINSTDSTDIPPKNYTLNYTICENYKNFKIIQSSGHSWVTDFDIECNKIKTGLIGSLTFLGVLFGSWLFQILPDTIGRRKTMILGGCSFSVILFLFIFINDIYQAYFLSFFLQIFAYLGLLSIFLIVNEVSSPESRSVYGAIINSAFSFSGLFYIAMFYWLNNWRYCFIIGSVFNLVICFIYMKYGYESPRYYLAKGEVNQAITVFTQIAVFNGREKQLKEELQNEKKSSLSQDEFNHVESDLEDKSTLTSSDKNTLKNEKIRIDNSLNKFRGQKR